MKSKKEMITVRYIPISRILRGKSYSSFDALRQDTNKLIKPLRDNWLQSVFIKHNIFVNFELMTRREIVEIFDRLNVRIVDTEDVYRVYKGKRIIGEWDNNRKIVFNKEGRMSIKIRYVIV